MSFGVGVGDVIQVSQLCWKAWHACTSGRKAAVGELDEVENDLHSLSTCLERLASNLAEEAQDQPSKVQGREELEKRVQQSKALIEELNEFLDKHRPQSSLDPNGTPKWSRRMKGNWRKIMWDTNRQKVKEFRDRIRINTEGLNVLLSVLDRFVPESLLSLNYKLTYVYQTSGPHQCR